MFFINSSNTMFNNRQTEVPPLHIQVYVMQSTYNFTKAILHTQFISYISQHGPKTQLLLLLYI